MSPQGDLVAAPLQATSGADMRCFVLEYRNKTNNVFFLAARHASIIDGAVRATRTDLAPLLNAARAETRLAALTPLVDTAAEQHDTPQRGVR